MRQSHTASRHPNPILLATAAFLLLTPLLSARAFSQAAPESVDPAIEARAASAKASKKHRRRQGRPIELGTSGGSVEDFTAMPPNVACCGGTLGALLEKQDRYFILSNNHVLGRFNQAVVGESIGQPGLNDTNCEAPDKNVVGTFAGFKRLKLNGKNKADVAIAETSMNDVSGDGAILGIGVPGNQIVNPRVGSAVVKSGRSTGVTRSMVSDTNVTGFVTFPEECGSDTELMVDFRNVFLVAGGDFSAGGDSGSVIYEDVGSCARAMGLLFAGTANFTAANRMKDVLKAVKKIPPKGRAELVGCEPLADSSDRRITRADRAERNAMRVQRWAEDEVLAVPGVVAMGIGRPANQGDEVVFRVFVEDSKPEIAEALPKSIAGVPVEVVMSGRFRALSCPSEVPSGPVLGGLDMAGAH